MLFGVVLHIQNVMAQGKYKTLKSEINNSKIPIDQRYIDVKTLEIRERKQQCYKIELYFFFCVFLQQFCCGIKTMSLIDGAVWQKRNFFTFLYFVVKLLLL